MVWWAYDEIGGARVISAEACLRQVREIHREIHEIYEEERTAAGGGEEYEIRSDARKKVAELHERAKNLMDACLKELGH